MVGPPARHVPVDPLAEEPFGAAPTEPLRLISAGAPGPPAAAPAARATVRRRKPPSARKGLLLAAVLLGVAGLAVSLIGLAGQMLPRQLTGAEQKKIMAWEVASRWRTWPAGKIFPASAGYQLPWTLYETKSGLSVSAHRVGIARQSTCATAIDPGLALALGRDGCEGVLRATYTDSTGSFVATVAVVIMHGKAPAVSGLPARHGLSPGVRAVPFRGTPAARFGNRQRQMTGAAAHGPYLILYAAGYADGRQRDHVSSNPYASGEMRELGTSLARYIGGQLGAPPPTPRCPGAPGC